MPSASASSHAFVHPKYVPKPYSFGNTNLTSLPDEASNILLTHNLAPQRYSTQKMQAARNTIERTLYRDVEELHCGFVQFAIELERMGVRLNSSNGNGEMERRIMQRRKEIEYEVSEYLLPAWWTRIDRAVKELDALVWIDILVRGASHYEEFMAYRRDSIANIVSNVLGMWRILDGNVRRELRARDDARARNEERKPAAAGEGDWRSRPRSGSGSWRERSSESGVAPNFAPFAIAGPRESSPRRVII